MNRLLLIPIAVLALAASMVEAKPAVKPVHVALVGDSLAYGAGDEEGKGIAGRISPELRSRGVATVVTTNLGRTGATTSQVAARLREPAARETLASADAIVLSMGANDLREVFEGGLFNVPYDLVDRVLENVRTTVTDLRRLNPDARILILGAYAPLPDDRVALFLEPLIAAWDSALAMQFADDPRVTIVRLSDIIDRPERLSRLDSFHPGAEAYQQAAARIAALMMAKE